MKKLKKSIKMLKKIISFHEGRPQNEIINMDQFAECALGQYIAAHHDAHLRGYNARSLTEQLFGVELDMVRLESDTKWVNRLERLFSTLDGDWTERKTFIKRAYKVLNKLEDKLAKKEFAKL